MKTKNGDKWDCEAFYIRDQADIVIYNENAFKNFVLNWITDPNCAAIGKGCFLAEPSCTRLFLFFNKRNT